MATPKTPTSSETFPNEKSLGILHKSVTANKELAEFAKKVADSYYASNNTLKSTISSTKENTKSLEQQLINLKQQQEEGKKTAKLGDGKVVRIKKAIALTQQELDLSKEAQIRAIKNYKMDLLKTSAMSSYNSVAGNAGNKVMSLGLKLAEAADPMEALVMLVELGVDRFVELQKAAEDFRHNTGLTLDQSRESTKQAELLNRKYQQLGVSVKDAYDSIQAMVEEVGNVRAVDNMKEMTEASTLLKSNFNIAAKDSVGFLFQMQKVGGVTSSGAANMAGYASKMAKAAGIPLGALMKDVAGASGETLSMVRGSAIELIKAAAQAKMLGVNLNAVGASARGFLNFNESIRAEMEASVLSGKNVNFQLARQKAWQGDIVGAQKEALSVVKSAGDFTKMNAFQQEALAKASGYSVEQLQKMLQNEKAINQLHGKDREDYDVLMKMKQKSVELTGAELLKQAKMQSVTTNLNNAFQGILTTLADILTPIVGILTKNLVPVIKLISAQVKAILTPISAFGQALEEIYDEYLGPMNDEFSDMFTGLDEISQKVTEIYKDIFKPLLELVLSPILSIVKQVRTLFSGIKQMMAGDISGGFKTLIKGMISALIDIPLALVKVVGSIFKLIVKYGKDSFKNAFSPTFWTECGQQMLTGLWDAFVSIPDIVKEVFNDAKTNIAEWFGQSPSDLGLSIVTGIESIGSMIFDALTTPFVKGIDFVKSLIPDSLLKLIGGNKTEISSTISGTEAATGKDTSDVTDLINKLIDVQQQTTSALQQIADAMNSGVDINNFDVMKFTKKIAMTANRQGSTAAPI